MATERDSLQTFGRHPLLGSIAGLGRRRLSPAALWAVAREWFLFRAATLGLDLVILMAMALLLMGTVLAMGGQIRFLQASVLLPGLACVAVLAITLWRHPASLREDLWRILRDWVPFLFVVFLYENLHDVAGQVTDFDIAGILHRWDVALLGVEPTLWAQRLFSPLLTDLMSILYALYFFEPLLIMFFLSLWNWRQEFRDMSLAVTIAFLLGFAGYVFLPASPPRYFIESLFTDPARLTGLFLFQHLQGAWDNLSVISGGAFPSLHVGLSTVALIYAWRLRNRAPVFRTIWWAYVPLVLGLWFSTVYLRHHWVIDIVAGWLVAGIAVVLAGVLLRAWGRLRARFGLG